MIPIRRKPRSHGRSRPMVVFGALLATAGFAAAPLLPAEVSSGRVAASARAEPAQGEAGSEFARQMETDMRRMMAAMHAAPHTGRPDVDFLAMMIPHHQGAVDMARFALLHGEDPLTRRLAEEIIASQTAEIAAMRARLDALRSGPTEADDYPALGGHRGGEGASRPPGALDADRGPPHASRHH